MNRTRGSTPPNPTPNLPICSTDSNKTLGIVGTPHGTPYPSYGAPKLVESRGTGGFLPRTPQTLEQRKPQNRAPFLMVLGWESKGKEPRTVHVYIPQQIVERKVSKSLREKHQEKGSENHQKGKPGRTQTSVEEPRQIIYTYHEGSYKV
jgi:hypothetical protein